MVTLNCPVRYIKKKQRIRLHTSPTNPLLPRRSGVQLRLLSQCGDVRSPKNWRRLRFLCYSLFCGKQNTIKHIYKHMGLSEN